MAKRVRRKFSEQEKARAVADYVSGKRTTAQIGAEFGCAPNLVYRWKAAGEAANDMARAENLTAEGHNPADVKRIMDLEDELAEYKKRLAEEILINDLLKKLRDSRSSRPESELTGLIRTSKSLSQKRKPGK